MVEQILILTDTIIVCLNNSLFCGILTIKIILFVFTKQNSSELYIEELKRKHRIPGSFAGTWPVYVLVSNYLTKS